VGYVIPYDSISRNVIQVAQVWKSLANHWAAATLYLLTYLLTYLIAVYNRRSTISARGSCRGDQSLGSSKKARANHRKWPDRPTPVVKIGSPRVAPAPADIANSRNSPNSSISARKCHIGNLYAFVQPRLYLYVACSWSRPPETQFLLSLLSSHPSYTYPARF